jgi:3-methyladenine DNA glycosylase/8-oxoguanine DNA glycosylase
MSGARSVRIDVWRDHSANESEISSLLDRICTSYGFQDDLSNHFKLVRANGHARPFKKVLHSRISCPESLFEITVISVLLQNTTVSRSTQMLKSLLVEAGSIVEFDGVRLRAFFTPDGLRQIGQRTLRDVCRVGYRARTLEAVGEYFCRSEPCGQLSPDVLERLLDIRGIGPYSLGVIASAALRDPRAISLDVWNTQIVAMLFDLDGRTVNRDEVRNCLSAQYPEVEGLTLLYATESACIATPLDPLADSVSDARRKSHKQLGD